LQCCCFGADRSGYNDEKHILEDPETDGNREKEAGAKIGLQKEESKYTRKLAGKVKQV
jgi:hypothetical protein